MKDLVSAWEAHPQAGWVIFITLAVIALAWAERDQK